MKILILCTGNSCRSQMAHGILQALNSNTQVFSAGTNPAACVHPKAIQVMAELDLDITQHFPKNINQYLEKTWDYLITVCGGANENCPLFIGDVKQRLHMGFTDPADAKGTEEEILIEFRKIRDEILRDFFKFNIQRLKK